MTGSQRRWSRPGLRNGNGSTSVRAYHRKMDKSAAVMESRRNALISQNGLVLVLLGVGLVLLAVPKSAIQSVPGEVMAWSAFLLLMGAGLLGWKLSRQQGETPWLYPAGALMIFFALRYGLGSLSVFYRDAIPWTVNADYVRRSCLEAKGNMAYGGYLCILGGVGLMLGTLLRAEPMRRFLPALPWRIGKEGLLGRCLLIVMLAASCLVLARHMRSVIPGGLQLAASLIGGFGFVLSMVSIICYVNGAGAARWKWLVITCLFLPLGAWCGLSAFPAMREGVVWPLAVVCIAYLLVRVKPVWFLGVGMAALVLVVFPLATLYKRQSETEPNKLRVVERIPGSFRDYLGLSTRERLEMGAQTLIGRLFGGPKFICVFSRYWPSRYPFEKGETFKIEARFLLPRLFFPERGNPDAPINEYSRKAGILGAEDATTSAKMDSITEYYINWGPTGVFFLFVLHGYFWKVLYDWLVRRGEWLMGAPIVACLLWSWHDFNGIGFVFTATVKALVVWIPLTYLLAGAKRSRAGVSSTL